MIELILSTLAEFGLIREDFKHHRKISIMEKADGKKRPFQRYFLQPSSIMVISVLVIGSLSAILFFTYQRKSVFPEKTKQKPEFRVSEKSASFSGEKKIRYLWSSPWKQSRRGSVIQYICDIERQLVFKERRFAACRL